MKKCLKCDLILGNVNGRRKHCFKCREAINLRNSKENIKEYAAKYYSAIQAFKKCIMECGRCGCCNDLDIIEFYYKMPKGHNVDHIIPRKLRGKHCLKNLQYLNLQDHGKKSRKEQEFYKKFASNIKWKSGI